MVAVSVKTNFAGVSRFHQIQTTWRNWKHTASLQISVFKDSNIEDRN